MFHRDHTPVSRIGRLAALLVVAMALVGACGGDDDASGPETPESATSVAPSTTAPAETQGSTSAPPATTTAAADGIQVVHRFGETIVPNDPQRVVVLDTVALDPILALGIVPAVAPDSQGFAPWLDERLEIEGIEIFPGPIEGQDEGNFNLELIASYDPDLIVGFTLPDSGTFELLSEIAPTLVPSEDQQTLGWRQVAREVASAFDRVDDMEALIADAEAANAEIAADIAERGGLALTFGLVRAVDTISVPLAVDNSRVHLRELGITEPERWSEELGDGEDATVGVVSLERVDILDADVILLSYRDPSVETELLDNPLFQAVPAVADGRYGSVELSVAGALRIPGLLAQEFINAEVVPLILELADP